MGYRGGQGPTGPPGPRGGPGVEGEGGLMGLPGVSLSPRAPTLLRRTWRAVLRARAHF